jgi:serine/threonine protein kinase
MRTIEREPAPGSRLIIANRYEIDVDNPLGRGGMAMVYPGRDLKTRRKVAVKSLRPEYQRDPESHRRFRSESRLLATVSSHPNIVSLYDFHNETSGSWMVMEYIEGENLRTLLEEEGPLDPETVMVILDQVGKALAHIHHQGLVHLDVKPQNLIRTPDGTMKLIDFGVAQRAGSPQEKIGGSAFGTAAYLAPEQASGRTVSAATDVYALGCVVYELLTGQTPFVAEGPDEKRQLIDAHLNARPQAPSTVRPELELPTWIDDVLGWALAKDPNERFHDVETFVEMFDTGLAGETPEHLPQHTRPFEPQMQPTPSGSRFRRRPTQRVVSPTDDADDGIADVRPLQDSTARRLYRSGGRIARRSRRARRTLWRLVAMLLIANMVLAVVLMAKDGPSALVERFLAIAPGTSTEVVTETLNMRTSPGTTSPIVLVLNAGQDVKITGLSEEDDQGRWWPVEVEQGGETYEGWVWEGGLQPNAWAGRLSWMQGIADGVNSTKERFQNGVDRVLDIIPGVRIALPAL